MDFYTNSLFLLSKMCSINELEFIWQCYNRRLGWNESQFVSTAATFPHPVARASKIPDFLSEAESCFTFSLKILNYGIVACSQNIATGRQRTVSTQSDARGLTFLPHISGLPVRDSEAAAVAARLLYGQDTTTTVDWAITCARTHAHTNAVLRQTGRSRCCDMRRKFLGG